MPQASETQPRMVGLGFEPRHLAGESVLSYVTFCPVSQGRPWVSPALAWKKSQYETRGTILSKTWNKFNIQCSLIKKA